MLPTALPALRFLEVLLVSVVLRLRYDGKEKMNARLRLTCAGVLVVWVAFTCWFYVRFLALEPDSALAQIPSLLGSGNDDESDADKILLVVIQTEPEGIEIRSVCLFILCKA